MKISYQTELRGMLLCRRLVLSALMAACVGATFAQNAAIRAEVPTLKVGDRWKFEQNDRRTGVRESGLDQKITSVTASQIEGIENDGKLLMTTELNIVETSTAVVVGESKRFNFPLVIGNKWDYKYQYVTKLNGNKGRWQLQATVVGYEKIKVPAGEFDAFKIEYTGFWNNDANHRNGNLKITNWFAPATRSLVKTEYDDGYSNWVRQLVEFRLQP